MQEKEKIYSIERYVSDFNKMEESLNGESKSFFHNLRKNAIARFKELGFPTMKNEEWKYTNVSPIFNFDFSPVNADKVSVKSSDIEKYLIGGLKVNLVVIVNGVFRSELSQFNSLPKGVIIDNLSHVVKSNPEIIENNFSKFAKLDNAFIALNTAFASEGIVMYVPDNKIVEDPVHILNLSGNGDKHVLSQPRNLIVMGKSAQVKIIESYHSIGESANLTNVVTEVITGENSYVELYKIQNENFNSFHFNLTQVEQQKNSNFTTYTVSLGGAITRNDLNAVLDDENIQANLYGLYILEGKQHVDNHTLIDHAKPHCESRELYKGVLDGKSRGVFNGKVFVRKDAQKTNAYQSNKAMLLSKEALIDTKPQLEIYADDVKCSHGAAIGQLDEESIFYLRSRGIGEEQAKAVLIRAFANDVFDEIKLEPLHEHLNHLVFEKLN